MTYDTPEAFRRALEARIGNLSLASGLAADRLRRQVIFQHTVARLQAAEPGTWVVKGGMALEARIGGHHDSRRTSTWERAARRDGPANSATC